MRTKNMLRCHQRSMREVSQSWGMGAMTELRLVFQPAPEATMTVRADFSSADGGMRSGGQPQPFTFQLRPEEYADVRWYLEEFMDLPIGGSVLRAHRTGCPAPDQRRSISWPPRIPLLGTFSGALDDQSLHQLSPRG
jgi:hypothetical protein